jgi:hypothetical protein
MKVSDIKKKIKLAQEAVNGLDEPYKLETYKIILKSSLNLTSTPPVEENEQNNAKFTPKIDELPELDQGMMELSNLCKITTRELFDVLKIENNEVIIKKILTGTERQQQILGSQLILLGYEFCMNNTEVDSETLKKCLKKSHIKDKNRNFSSYIKNEKTLFSLSSKGATRNMYSLTSHKGRSSAIALLIKLAKGE